MFFHILAACFYITLAKKPIKVLPQEDPVETFLLEQRQYEVKEYLPYYHITTPTGWLNEPAAFVRFNKKYHIFYQFYPFTGPWGSAHWGHVVSTDLVRWHHYPTALVPTEEYDADDCLAGSAHVIGGKLSLFYTGRYTKKKNTVYTQNLAVSYDGITFKKYEQNPLLNQTFQKNPMVWMFESMWYMLVGSSTPDNRGCLVLYRSFDTPFAFQKKAIVAESMGDMGHLWENPDTFKLNGWDVIIMSVRGLKPKGNWYKNRIQTGYVIGRLNYATGRLEDAEISTHTFNELDRGHNFVAAKTMLAADGRRLLVGWLGMWKREGQSYPPSSSSGFLTVIRELTINNQSQLLMNPIVEMKKLRKKLLEDRWYMPCETIKTGRSVFELVVRASNPPEDTMLLTLEWSGNVLMQYSIMYRDILGTMSVSRGGKDGQRTAYWRPEGSVLEWRIFVDTHSVEVFCGKGELVFSSRFFPRGPLQILIGGSTPLHIKLYKLKRNLVAHDKAVRDMLKKRLRVSKLRHLTKDNA